MSISERIRPGIEAAEWVCKEVAALEVSYEALLQQVKDLKEWQAKAFDAHPNIDIDIERLPW